MQQLNLPFLSIVTSAIWIVVLLVFFVVRNFRARKYRRVVGMLNGVGKRRSIVSHREGEVPKGLVAVVQGVGEVDLGVVAVSETTFIILVIEKDGTQQSFGNLGVAGRPGAMLVVDVGMTAGLERVHVDDQVTVMFEWLWLVRVVADLVVALATLILTEVPGLDVVFHVHAQDGSLTGTQVGPFAPVATVQNNVACALGNQDEFPVARGLVEKKVPFATEGGEKVHFGHGKDVCMATEETATLKGCGGADVRDLHKEGALVAESLRNASLPYRRRQAALNEAIRVSIVLGADYELQHGESEMRNTMGLRRKATVRIVWCSGGLEVVVDNFFAEKLLALHGFCDHPVLFGCCWKMVSKTFQKLCEKGREVSVSSVTPIRD